MGFDSIEINLVSVQENLTKNLAKVHPNYGQVRQKNVFSYLLDSFLLQKTKTKQITKK